MSFFILSCSFRRADEIAISTNFTIEQQTVIIYAINQWFAKCPELEVDVYISDEPTVVPMSCTENSKKGFTALRKFKRPIAYICTTDIINEDEFRIVSMHEIGHYLTVKSSHTSATSIMQESIDDNNVKLEYLTSKDIKWGCG